MVQNVGVGAMGEPFLYHGLYLGYVGKGGCFGTHLVSGLYDSVVVRNVLFRYVQVGLLVGEKGSVR